MIKQLITCGLITALLSGTALAENMPKSYVATRESKATGMMLSSTAATEEVDFTEYANSGNAFAKLVEDFKEKFTQAQARDIAFYTSAHLLNSATLTAADEKDINKGGENINGVNSVLDELYGSNYQQDDTVVPLSAVAAKNENEMKTLLFAELQLQRIAGKDKEDAIKSIAKLKTIGIGMAQGKPVDITDEATKEVLFTIMPNLSPGVTRVLAEYIGAGAAKAAQLKYIEKKDSKDLNDISNTLIDVANNEFYQIVKPYNTKNAEQNR